MRLIACLGMIALALGGCQHIPAYLTLDVDGTTVEFKKRPPPAPENAAEPAAADDGPAG